MERQKAIAKVLVWVAAGFWVVTFLGLVLALTVAPSVMVVVLAAAFWALLLSGAAVVVAVEGGR